MSLENPETAVQSHRKLWGGIVMAAGLLIACLCGLCSGGALIIAIGSGDSGSFSIIFLIMLVVGIAPMIAGIGIYGWGRKIYQNASRPNEPSDPV
jgi:hypothetical protein